jgi:hypothetical protein
MAEYHGWITDGSRMDHGWITDGSIMDGSRIYHEPFLAKLPRSGVEELACRENLAQRAFSVGEDLEHILIPAKVAKVAKVGI